MNDYVTESHLILQGRVQTPSNDQGPLQFVPNFLATSAPTSCHIPTRTYATFQQCWTVTKWLFTSSDIGKSFLLPSMPFLPLLYNSYLLSRPREKLASLKPSQNLGMSIILTPMFLEHYVQTYCCSHWVMILLLISHKWHTQSSKTRNTGAFMSVPHFSNSTYTKYKLHKYILNE